MTRWLLLFICSLIGTYLAAQDLVKTIITIEPKNAFIQIDNESTIDLSQIDLPYTTNLSVGEHIIKVWHPTFELHIDTITIEKGKINHYKKGLVTQATSFKAYRTELDTYSKQKAKRTRNTTMMIGSNVLLLWFAVDGGDIWTMSNIKKDIDNTYNSYINALTPENIRNFQVEHQELQERYNKKRKTLYWKRAIGIPIVAVSSYFTYKLLKKRHQKKLVKPTYAPKNPLTLSSLGLDTSVERSIALQLNFNF